MTTRLAYVARHPFLPGAYAYLNAKHVEEGQGADTLERWLAQGATVAKVPLYQAVRELQEHIDARRMEQLQQTIISRATPFPCSKVIIDHNPSPEHLPIFFRKQAD
jgi:hypothetical protein